MARQKGSKNKSKGVQKTGILLKDGGNPFTMGIEKTSALNKEATGEYAVTQTQSFFYSPELNTMGS